MSAPADGIVFQRLLSNLASRLANTSPDHFHETVEHGLCELAGSLGADEACLWCRLEEVGDLLPAVRWVAPGLEPLTGSGPLRRWLPNVDSDLRVTGALWFDSLDDVPEPRHRETFARASVRSFALLPLIAGGHLVGALGIAFGRAHRVWDPVVRLQLRLFASVLALTSGPRRPEPRAQRTVGESAAHRRSIAPEPAGRPLIAAESEAAREVLRQVDSVAPTHATVLLTGETGTGKEVFAQAIHDRSPRRDRPMVRVNCAAIPAALIESELFGRERGAYTGALSRQIGRFELADGGTLFLDEIGELPLESQVKLLRVIQDRVVERLGSTDPIQVDVRVIAATNRDLEAAVSARTFREDLFYRLNVFPIGVPPLRERVKDIPVLVWSFIEEFARASSKRIEAVEPESLAALQRHHWPGNVRELRNLVERAVILARGPRLTIETPHAAPPGAEARGTLAEAQVAHIRGVLEQVSWRVRGPGGAAERLGMKPTTLESRMVKLGIRRQAGR
jgi:transcriptional regulator with GAF, ATPase, and Fis domain